MQRAVELEKKDVGGKSDPYCLIQYGDQKYQTKVNPVSHHRVKYGVRSLKFIWAPVYSCTHWPRPRTPPRIWSVQVQGS